MNKVPKIKAYRSVIENLALNKEETGVNLAEQFSIAFQRMQTHDSRLSEIKDCWKMLRLFLAPFSNPKKNFLKDEYVCVIFIYNFFLILTFHFRITNHYKLH